MLGIAGVFAARDMPLAPKLLGTMLQSMMHEPRAFRKSSINARQGWSVGAVATSRADLLRMPISNEDGVIALWLSGECFVDPATKAALKNQGHVFDPDGAECLVHLYEEEGPGFAGKLNGLFSGVVLDTRNSTAVLFTDRYSLRRLYYHEDANGFYFASEAKALLSALPHLRTIAPQSMAEYLCFDCVLGERSFFRGVEVLPGGAVWTGRRGRMEKRRGYNAGPCEEQPPLDAGEFCERLASAFEQAVHRRIGGGRIGLAVSGGLDSRLILSCLPGNCQCVTAFTSGGLYRDSVDMRIARQVCKKCRIDHETVRLDTQFLASYASIAARAVYVTDGLADATNAHIIYLDEKVRRQIGPVAMSGAFGSQVLGRVRPALRYRAPGSGLIHGDFQPYVAGAASALSLLPPESGLAFAAKREIPWYWSRFMSAHFSQYNLRLPFLDNDFFDLLFRAPREGCEGSRFEMAAIESRCPELMRVCTNQGWGGSAPPLVSRFMRRFMDSRAKLEKVFNWDTLPHSMQHLAARIDAHMLSPLRLDRHILGWEYYLHYNRWFRNELAAALQDILLSPRTLTRPYWNAACVRRIVDDHVHGRRNNLAQIRKILTVELIHRELLERTASRNPMPAGAEEHAAPAT